MYTYSLTESESEDIVSIFGTGFFLLLFVGGWGKDSSELERRCEQIGARRNES